MRVIWANECGFKPGTELWDTYQSLYLRTFTNIEIILLSSIELNNIIESMGKSQYQLINAALPTAQLEVHLLPLRSWSWRCLIKQILLVFKKWLSWCPLITNPTHMYFPIKKKSKQQWIGSGNYITPVSCISPTNPLIFQTLMSEGWKYFTTSLQSRYKNKCSCKLGYKPLHFFRKHTIGLKINL